MEKKSSLGVFTTSTSARVLETVEGLEGGNEGEREELRKALLVCMVIAG